MFARTTKAQGKRFRIGGRLGEYTAENLVILNEINGQWWSRGGSNP
jgi:hypothetical protein